MNKILFKIILLVCLLTIPFAEVYADDYETVIQDALKSKIRAQYNVELNAPFSKETSGVNEIISNETGELNVSYSFFELDTNEEFGLSLSIINSLNKSKRYEESLYYDDEYYNTVTGFTDTETALGGFGCGWSWNLPYIDNNMIHLPDGRTFEIDLSSGNGLSEYTLENLKLKSDTAVSVENKKSAYALIYNNGDKYYFADDGLLIRRNDRFENALYYHWKTVDNVQKLSSVSDSLGRKINITYSGLKVYISYLNKQYIINSESFDEDNVNILKSITDPMGNKTEFSYDVVSTDFNLVLNAYKARNAFYPIKSVKYVSGLLSCYEYEKAVKPVYTGEMDYLRVIKRYDINNDERINEVKYSYQKTPYCGGVYKTFIYESSGKSVQYDFSEEHLITRKTVKENNRKTSESIYYYDKNKIPVKTHTLIYNNKGDYRKLINETLYDSKGNLIKTDTYSDVSEKGNNVIEYRYNPIYNLLTYQKINKDKSTFVEYVGAISEKGKFIKSVAVKENGKKIKEDNYDYNVYGNIINSKEEFKKGVYKETEYIYGVKNYPLLPTTIITKGVETPDSFTDIISKFSYDKYGNKISETDGNGNVTKYEYDLSNRLVKVIFPDDTVNSYKYNDIKNTVVTKDSMNVCYTYNYNQTGNLVSVKNNAGDIIIFKDYDRNGNIIKETDSLGNYITYTYDGLNRIINKTYYDSENSLLEAYDYSYDTAYQGKYIMLTEKIENRITKYIFDYRENLIEKITGDSENIRTYQYTVDYMGNVLSECLPSGLTKEYEYDVFGNVIRAVNNNTEEKFKYSFNGLLLEHINGENEKTEYDYNAFGKEIIKIIPGGNGGKSITNTYYDCNLNPVKTVTDKKYVTNMEYDSRNRLVKHIVGKNEEKTVTLYEYDTEGRLVKKSYGTDKKLNHNYYKYDDMGNLISETDNMGYTAYYEYDLNQNLVKAIDKNNTVMYNEYDGLNRMIKTSNSTDKEAFKEYAYNYNGELQKVIYNGVQTEFKYNSFGELVLKTIGDEFHRYSYNDDGNLISYEMDKLGENQIKLDYSYDVNGRLKAVKTPIGTQSYYYDKANRVLSEKNDMSMTEVKYTYYPSGQIKSARTLNGGKITDNLYYEYDSIGNRIFEYYETVDSESVKEYEYDLLNRIKKVNENNEKTTEYSYDDFLNIKNVYTYSDSGVTKTQYEYDGNNRLVMLSDDNGVINYGYDKHGNLIKKDDDYYYYDGYNKLTGIVTPTDDISYSYDYTGLRTSKTVNGVKTDFVNDGQNVVAEFTEERKNVYYRGNSLIGYKDEQNNIFYYALNAHGDVTGLKNILGEPVKNYEYDVFGNQKADEDYSYLFLNQQKEETEDNNPFRYCGEYQDLESGLIYLRNRYYDPSIGRFITEDPAKDGLNWYVYCSNNPVMFVDPLGLEAGDFVINGNPISYTQEYQTGTYGSARDVVTALGGQIGNIREYDNSVYMKIADLSFRLHLSNNYGKATVYSSNGSIGQVQYTHTNDRDNPGCIKLQINLQDIIDILVKCNMTPNNLQWDLGDVGGTYVAVTPLATTTNTVIPMDMLEEYYSSDSAASIIISGLGEDGIASAVGTMLGNWGGKLWNDSFVRADIRSGAPFELLYKYEEYFPEYSKEEYYFPYNSRYLNCHGKTVGSFKVGQY